jgi:hypothetical protein
VICALAGDDRVFGRGGYDTLILGRGVDRGFGGRGDDHIYSGGKADFLSGGAGDDIIVGQRGPDLIWDSHGLDVLLGNAGDDKCLDAEDGGAATKSTAVPARTTSMPTMATRSSRPSRGALCRAKRIAIEDVNREALEFLA